MAGNGDASTGSNYFRTFYGVARNANLVDVRVLEQDGTGHVSKVVAGIQWVVANKDKYNIRVINLSLGTSVGESYTTDPLCQAVEAAWKAGIVVVCAAGNEGRAQRHPDDRRGQRRLGHGVWLHPVAGQRSLRDHRRRHEEHRRQPQHDGSRPTPAGVPAGLDMVMKPDIVAPGNKIISLYASKSYL